MIAAQLKPVDAKKLAPLLCPAVSAIVYSARDAWATARSGSAIETWFINHPEVVPSSAVWWLGDHSSGCTDYTSLPDCPGGAVGCP